LGFNNHGVFMSKNCFQRQFLKASGSFFVGASIAIGTICPIVLTSSRALADSYSVGIPTLAANELQNLANLGITPNTIAFTPNGGWVILYGSNGYDSSNLPQDALTELAAIHNQKSTINTIAFTPSGEWIIIFGGYGYYPSANFPQDALNEITTLNQQKTTINSVTFTPNGEWVIISNNGYHANWSSNFPQNAQNTILTKLNAGDTLQNIAFTPSNGWVLLYQPSLAQLEEILPVEESTNNLIDDIDQNFQAGT